MNPKQWYETLFEKLRQTTEDFDMLVIAEK